MCMSVISNLLLVQYTLKTVFSLGIILILKHISATTLLTCLNAKHVKSLNGYCLAIKQ